jgi:hypothetical protein
MTMHGHRPAPPACIMITLCHTFDQASLHTCVVTHSDSVHWRAPHVCACEFACVCVRVCVMLLHLLWKSFCLFEQTSGVQHMHLLEYMSLQLAWLPESHSSLNACAYA